MSPEDGTSDSMPSGGDVERNNSTRDHTPSAPTEARAKSNANDEIDEFGLPIKRIVRRKTLEEEKEARVLASHSVDDHNEPKSENKDELKDLSNEAHQKEESKDDEFPPPVSPTSPPPPHQETSTSEPSSGRQRSMSKTSKHSSIDYTH